MKKLLLAAVGLLMAIPFSSCTVVDEVPDDNVIVTLGVPRYDVYGTVVYYEYGGYHYYPRYYNGSLIYRRYAIPHRMHRYDHAGRPRSWGHAMPTRPRPSGPSMDGGRHRPSVGGGRPGPKGGNRPPASSGHGHGGAPGRH